MSDLVTRLRRWADTIIANEVPEVAQSMTDAADEIERLRAEIAVVKMEWQSADQWRAQIHQAERERDEAVALLKECRTQVIHADSTLSAYGHGRVITKTEALEQSSRLRDVTARLDAFLTGRKS